MGCLASKPSPVQSLDAGPSELNASSKSRRENQHLASRRTSTDTSGLANSTLSKLLASLSEVRGATWLGRLHSCARLTAETFRAHVRIFAFTPDGSQYVLVASRGPGAYDSRDTSSLQPLSLVGALSGSCVSSSPTGLTSITLAARNKAPLVHSTTQPYCRDGGVLPADWQDLTSPPYDARTFATVPLLHGRECMGAVLIAAPAATGKHAGPPSALAGLNSSALEQLGLALSLYCVAESADNVSWLAACLAGVLDSSSLQQAISVLCSGVTDYVSSRFMLHASVQATLLAEPDSGVACMITGSAHTGAPGNSDSGAGNAASAGGYNSAPQSLHRNRSTSRRSQLSGVRRVLAEASAYGTAGDAAARTGSATSRNHASTAAEGGDEPEGVSASGVSASNACFWLHEHRVLKARTFKLAATLFQQLVADGGVPRGAVVEDCARHVQDVHKPTRDVAMLIQGTGARALVLTGVSLSNSATLGLYVCFASRLPCKLLNAVHVAVYELLAEALRPSLDVKICEELVHEFEVIKAGVPGVYLSTTTPAPAPQPQPAPNPPSPLGAPAPRTSRSGCPSNSGAATGATVLPQPRHSAASALAVAPVSMVTSGPNGVGRRTPQPSQPSPPAPRTLKGSVSCKQSGVSSPSSTLNGYSSPRPRSGPGVGVGDDSVHAPAAVSRLSQLAGNSRGGGMLPGTLNTVARLDIEDNASLDDSSTLLDSVMALNTHTSMAGLSPVGPRPLPGRASSVIRVQELDGTTAIRNQMNVLVSSFQASLQDSHLDRIIGARTSAVADDIDQLQLVALLGRGGNGIVLRGLLAQVAVAVKLIGMPDPEPHLSDNYQVAPRTFSASAAGGRPNVGNLQRTQSSTGSRFGVRPPRTLNPHAHLRGSSRNGPESPQSSDEPAHAHAADDITPSEALSRRRELARGAMELAVLTTTSHPCLVQVFSYYTNVVLEEGVIGPDGKETYALRRLAPKDRQRGTPGAPLNVFTAVCMEWCDQGSMHDAIGTGRFHRPSHVGPNGETVYVIDLEAIYLTLLEVAMALRYLHARHILHRDIKPGNVLLKSAAAPVAADGDMRGFNAKLADFGFALQMDLTDNDKRPYVVPDQACGSVPYMAPETFRSGSKLDGAVDVYSMGIVMWEAVSGGEQPYQGIPTKDVPREVYQGRRPVFRPDVPYSYRALAQSCWAAQPAKRPTAAQLVTALKQSLGRP